MEIDKDSLQFIFASTIRALHKFSSVEFEKNGLALSPEQFHLLKIIASKEDSIQSELAEILQLDKSGIMRHIDQMETKGYVQRVNDASDRRKKYIIATEAGEAELEKCRAVLYSIGDIILKDISDAEILIFKQVLSKLKENAER
jgi:DNA-binding MarR family transcriptional regulator